jgi:hypothetical protein
MRSPATRQSDRANSQSSISSEKSNVPTIDFQAAKSLGEHALDYARRGWHVFPCKPSNKAPYIAGGLNRATTDPDVIAEWWGQWPHAMIGVRMGEVSGVWALDPDGPAEPGTADGRANWSELVAKNGGCPATHTHRTPGGGLHLLFKWREDQPITNREGRLKGLGINVRGNGGYVIAPPSCRHDGKTYDIAEPRDLFNFAEAPERLYDLILMKPAERPVMVQSAARALSARRYAEAALQGEAHEVAATITGKRNSRLNIAAVKLGSLVASGELSEGEVVDALYDSAVANGSVADDGHRQTVATIRSGMRHGLQNPRLIPEPDISAPVVTIMQAPASKIRATPYVWREPSSIPRREFLYGFHLIRKFTSAKFAAGGVGKSILALTEAIAMATGRPVLGIRPRQRCRVWYWNGEDPRDETDRRIAAICLHFGIAASELEGWLFVDSGRDQKIIIAAQNPRTSTVIATPVVRALVDTTTRLMF